MRTVKGISATTHVDSQGDKITVAALMKTAEDTNAAYYPFGVNHDPRIAPVGRLVKSRVVPRDGGEAALEFEAEVFEETDAIEFAAARRRLPAAILRIERELVYDRTFVDSEVDIIASLARDLGLRPRRRSKKAAEPLSVLIFSAAAGAVAGPFLGELGKDLYKFGKKQIMQLCALLRERRGKTRVLVLQFEIRRSSGHVHVEIFITNPTEFEIKGILDLNLSEIERSLHSIASNPASVKVVAEYSNRRVIPRFMVRADGVPFDETGRLVAYKGDLPNGISISFQEKESTAPK
jgi:hypothetical protein